MERKALHNNIKVKQQKGRWRYEIYVSEGGEKYHVELQLVDIALVSAVVKLRPVEAPVLGLDCGL